MPVKVQRGLTDERGPLLKVGSSILLVREGFADGIIKMGQMSTAIRLSAP